MSVENKVLEDVEELLNRMAEGLGKIERIFQVLEKAHHEEQNHRKAVFAASDLTKMFLVLGHTAVRLQDNLSTLDDPKNCNNPDCVYYEERA